MPDTDFPYDLMIEKGYNPVNDAIIQFLSKRVEGKYLDVGCNVGYLLEEAPNGIGVDASKKAVARAQSKGFNVIHGFAESLPYADKEFDTVVLSSILEQTPDWRKALREALRVGRRVIGINPYPGKSQWGRLGENPWVKSVIDPIDLPGAHIEPFNEFLYYFELESLEAANQHSAKLLLGGLMLGDAFHIIPYLNKLMREGVTKFYWVTGTYEKTAVEFLQLFYPIEATFKSDGSPSDLSARFMFSRNYVKEFESIDAGISISNVEASLCSGFFEPDRSLYTLNNIHLLNDTLEESIVLHPQTVHDWKVVPGMVDADWASLGLTAYTVGHSQEVLISNTTDFRGRTFFEVAKKIRASKLVVGIHSAIACLTLYLDKPMIVCHPWKEKPPSAFLHFRYFRDKMKDIINPPPDVLIDLTKRFLNGEEIPSEPIEGPKGL